MNLQPTNLTDQWVSLHPLQTADFERLFAVAADPLIWEQHPNKNRYQRAVFENFFAGAMESQGAFLITSTKTGEPIGSSRFCNYDAPNNTIEIGYTFFARSCWGQPYNRSTKKLMIDHAFKAVDAVIFFIGAENIRSQKAIEKIGAIKIDERIVPYFGEPERHNFVYEIKKVDWK